MPLSHLALSICENNTVSFHDQVVNKKYAISCYTFKNKGTKTPWLGFRKRFCLKQQIS